MDGPKQKRCKDPWVTYIPVYDAQLAVDTCQSHSPAEWAQQHVLRSLPFFSSPIAEIYVPTTVFCFMQTRVEHEY